MSNPFAQNTPQGPAGQPQQPGQQPYGQQPYGQVPPQGWGTAPPPPPQRKKPWLKIVAVVVGLIVVGIAVLVFNNKDSATKADVGDCLDAPSKTKDTKKVSCDSTKAAFRVVGKFSDTSNTSKCTADDMVAKGSLASFYWTGSGKGVLCLTITKYTTFEQASKVGATSQEELDQTREDLAAMGIPGVK